MSDMGEFRTAVGVWASGGDGEVVRELAGRVPVGAVVLLEGLSDAAAVEALAAGLGRDLAADGVCVLPMGGAMNVGRFAEFLGPSGLGLRLTGLCDENERPYYARGWERAGAGRESGRAGPEGAESGAEFFVCAADLEDELIRALGPARVAELVEAEGERRALEIFLRQPAQQGRAPQAQLRRFLGTKKGRKIRYGRVLVEALEPGRAPAPLAALMGRL
ncbi:TOPRIM nucleotidyl transferase/hydrolase domain-containing protein [Streptomyces sp. ODS05-4]|uniref:TOPRIM nucleotidyl transferase/hydrolase domain-containing protein n=1 Tax=Streptomyces sp. ODS05-4 TaxID=2944939 RepID=UPI00210EC767|nr:TOPRIM nucleotidyl transferase/hydrolase domain-containing protein [Streptomyces sp. ODS05-4]